jgi:uncharacterized protein YprB with RNaseH-like and TPR domain
MDDAGRVMLKNTFCHVPGIGPRVESRLWSAGYHSWESVLGKRCYELPERLGSALASHISRSADELEDENAVFFETRLPPTEQWRMFPEFRRSAAYLDIETTGLRPEFCTITTIALFDGRDIRYYVYGRNLDDFVNDVARYKLLITYNGKCFDIPFIERYFGIEVKAAQIDLRYVLRSLGYRGGLKGCEKQLGIDRGGLDGVDGYFAVLLWHDYVENGNDLALETLLAYNIEDVVNLETLMVTAYNLKIKRTPFARSNAFEAPKSPALPFKPDKQTIDRIRSTYFSR